jgi:hypothetical protein
MRDHRYSYILMLLATGSLTAAVETYGGERVQLAERSFSRYVLRGALATPVWQEVDYIGEWDSSIALRFDAMFVSPFDDGWNGMSGFALTFNQQSYEQGFEELDYLSASLRLQVGASYTWRRWRSELLPYVGGGLAAIDGTANIPRSTSFDFDETGNLFEYGIGWNLLYTTLGGVQVGLGLDFQTGRVRSLREFNDWDQDQIFLRGFVGYHF